MSLKVGWIGYGGNSWMAEELRPMIEELGMTLTTIHEHDNADIKWNKDTWYENLKSFDILISPANYRVQPAKSANRVTQALSLGKPVICSPMPSYVDVLKKHPGSFLVADDPEQWKEKFKILIDNPSYRQELSEKALEAAKGYSIDAIGNKWVELLKDLEPVVPEFVDIVIPTYKNLRGIKLCLNSIRECTEVNYRIIIVNNGIDEELHNYLQQQDDIIYIKKERLNFAQAVNVGIKAGDSKYVMILNDDVIVSKGWLKNMVEACTEGVGAVGLFSNCDKGWLHNYDVNIGGVEFQPGTNTYEEIEPIIPQIYEYESGKTEIKEQEWVAYYATLIPRAVIDDVGVLDEEFTNSGEDVDHCKRIRKMGYKILQTYKSFIFHFGAVSRKLLEQEDEGSYQKADATTQDYLKTKYEKETVVIYSGPSWERWSFENEKKGGIGGSEIWQISLAREFSNLGYRVISFCDSPETEMWDDDVRYLHYSKYPSFVEQNYIDYFITSRTTDTLQFPVRAGKVYVMVHDIWLLSPREQMFQEKVDKYCVLSQWHWDFFKNHHGVTDDNKMWMTSNGLYFDRYDKDGILRHPHRLFYSSSPDRGLDTLLQCFPFIKEKVPDLELHVYYGFNNWEKSILKRNDPVEIARMEEIKKGLEQDGVTFHGRVSQKELSDAQLSCSLWVYPTDFEEVFCITAIEAQRARMPIVTSRYAGLVTTLGDESGVYYIGNGTKGQSFTKEYRESLVETCAIILNSPSQDEVIQKGLQNSEKYSWQNVAKNWEALFHDKF